MKETTFAAMLAILLLISVAGIIFLGLAWGFKTVFSPEPTQHCICRPLR